MNAEKVRQQRRRIFFYPFLFSLYPVLFLYLRNIREVPLAQALLAGGASLGIALVVWPVTRLVATQPEKRALSLFFFLLLFHSYGMYYAALVRLLPDNLPMLAAHALAFTLPGGAWLLLNRALAHSPRTFASVNRPLGLAVLALVSWNLGGILAHQGQAVLEEARQAPPSQRAIAADVQGAPQRPGPKGPDIYCIVMDEYAAIESAQNLFQYNNLPFAISLQQQGFFVTRDSHSPFLKTEHALAALLNPSQFGGQDDPFPRIRRSEVVSFLKRRGYRIIDFAAVPAMFLAEADQRFYYSLIRVSIFFNDFYRTLFERSLLCFLPEIWSRNAFDVMPYYRERVLEVFRKLPIVAKTPGPKFVFVHLYCPHEPFVFDAQGGPVPTERAWDHADPQNYLQQYIFISRRILEMTTAILAGSPRPPLILIHSDHGYRGSRGRTKWPRIVANGEARRVFNALYLPDVPLAVLAPNLSPLNNFRLVFNHYFGTNYPLLPNDGPKAACPD